MREPSKLPKNQPEKTEIANVDIDTSSILWRGIGTRSPGNHVWPALSQDIELSGFYVNPENGKPSFFSSAISLETSVPIIAPISDMPDIQYYNFYDDDAYWELWEEDGIEDGCIGAHISTRRYILDKRCTETISRRFSPYVSLPEGFTDWVQYYSYSSNSLIRINATLSENLDFLVLSEQNSTSTLQYSLSSIFHGLETLEGFSRYVQVSNYCNTKALSDDASFYTKYLHVVHFPNRYSADKREFHDFSVLILKSTLTQ